MSFVISYIGSAVLFYSYMIFKVVMTLATIAYSAYQMATASSPKKDDNRLQTVRSAIQPHRIIYGETVVGGVLVYAVYHDINPYTGVHDKDKQANTYITLVVAFAGHEIESIEEIWLNDKLSTDRSFFWEEVGGSPEIAFDTIKYVDGKWVKRKVVMREAVPGEIRSYVHTTSYTGTIDQVADPFLLSLPSKPTTIISKYPQSGLSDLNIHNNSGGVGTFSGVGMAVFTLRVTAVDDTGDTVTWRKDVYEGDGITIDTASSGTVTTASGQHLLDDGISVYWDSITGHSVGQVWEVRAYDGQPWTKSCTLTNRPYVVVTLKQSDSKFPNGLPNIKAKIKGNNQIYDPRTDLTGYSNNWALCVRDYLAKPYGLDTPSDDINDTITIAAANVCDELVTLSNGTTEPRYAMNGSFTVDKTPTEIMNDMLLTAYGAITWTQGQYRILPAVYRDPDPDFHGVNPNVPGLTESDLRDSIKVRPLPSMKDKFNTVRGTFVSSETWEYIDFPKVKSDYYINQDGGVVSEKDIQFSYITSSAMAQRVAKIILEKARQAICVDFPAKWSAFPLAVGDNVPISISHLGWNQKIFTVTDWKLNSNGGVDLQLQEEAAACYDWNSGEETTTDLAQNTLLPDPTFVPKVTGLTVGEELYSTNVGSVIKSRAIISWDDMGCAEYRVEYVGPTNTIWASLPTVVNNTMVTLDDTTPGSYQFRISGMNYLGVWGGYTSISQVLTGKMAPPANVAGFTVSANKSWVDLSITPSGELDIDFYEIRFGATWDGGVVIATGLKTPAFSWQPPQSGNLQFWAKAVDTSGNYSTEAVTATLVINAAAVSGLSQQIVDNNVLLSWTNIPGTFDIDRVEVRQGLDYSTSTLIGSIKGTFTSIFEITNGTYKYWATPVDIAGLAGSPAGTYATVSQPPDYVLRDQRSLLLTGTFTDCINDNGALIAPVNSTETYQDHFTTHSYSSPGDQIDDGNPYYLQPAMSTGQYVETIDYGATISASAITLALTKTIIVGEVTITPVISTSLDGSTWIDLPTGYTVYAVDFRHVKISLSFATSDNGLVSIIDTLVRLDVKLKTLQGTCSAVSTDSGGTTVDITGEFVDVRSINVSPQGTTPVTAIYDFADIPNPTQFKVLMFDGSGARVSGTVSWTIRGVK